MEALPTITVELQDGSNNILMTWQHQVTANDVYAAFNAISALLETSDQPLSVIVDIRSSPNFPITATLNGALAGPFRSPKLCEWLILGSNPVAHIVERTLATTAQRRNVRWFAAQAELEAYLAGVAASSPRPLPEDD